MVRRLGSHRPGTVTACNIHGPGHSRRARPLLKAWRASLATRCWRCGRTLAEHPPHRNGRPATWTAGHIRDIDCPTCGRVHGDPLSPLQPEASVCNYSAGGRANAGESNVVVGL